MSEVRTNPETGLSYVPGEVAELPNGRRGVIGSDQDEDDAWGEYASMSEAKEARRRLEESEWDADRAGIRALNLAR